MDGCGTSRRRSAAPGSMAAESGTPAGGRSTRAGVGRRGGGPGRARAGPSDPGAGGRRSARDPSARRAARSRRSPGRGPPGRRGPRRHSGSRAGRSRRRAGAIQPRDATEPHAGQGRERRDGVGQRARASPTFAPSPMYARTGRATSPSLAGRSRRLQSPRAPRRGPNPAPPPRSGAGLLESSLAEARSANAGRLARLFQSAGAADVRIVAGRPDRRSFGERLRALVAGLVDGAGLVVLGSGSMPLARPLGVPSSSAAAASGDPRALANNRYSADVVADRAGGASRRRAGPAERTTRCRAGWTRGRASRSTTCAVAGAWRSTSTRRSTRPAHRRMPAAGPSRPLTRGPSSRSGSAGSRAVVADRRAELVVAGRTSATTLALARAVDGVADPGARRGARPPRDRPGAERRRSPRRSALGLGRSSTIAGPRRSGRFWPGSATARSSTRGSSWPIGSARARPPGRPPRIASHRTCSSPTASRIPGCGR